jgi:hypothetical protein
MQRQHPAPAMELPISLEIYHQLLGASAASGFEKESWEIGAAAIRDWMARHHPDSFAMPATAGFQWKSVFLPNGTVLRTIFNGKNFHCLVEDDRILYDGQSVSPSGFANAVGGVRRNAWKVVWILFPNTSEWKLAGTLRTSKNAHKPRSPGRQRANDIDPAPRPSGQCRPPDHDEPQVHDDRCRQEPRTCPDRRRVQDTVHQRHAPQPEPAQHRQERHCADCHARRRALEDGHGVGGGRSQARLEHGPGHAPPVPTHALQAFPAYGVGYLTSAWVTASARSPGSGLVGQDATCRCDRRHARRQVQADDPVA